MGKHMPVLHNEAIERLTIRDGGTYLDLTLGRAGHSSEILKRIPHGRLIAFDQDEEAIRESKERLSAIGSNFTIIHDNFENVAKRLDELGIEEVDGILMDLGVSSPQLDEAERGFSYKEEAPLDMRMDQSAFLTARDVVNTYSQDELTRVIREYGEDKDAYSIAYHIVEARKKKPIETTTELAEIVKLAKPRAKLLQKGHPAKQTFQAIRMEVNHETAALDRALADAPRRLAKGGRLAIITFMSLDDRAVKKRFRELTTVEGSRTGFELPDEIKEAEFLDLTRKPIAPSEQEVEENHRSVSAKLRGIERL